MDELIEIELFDRNILLSMEVIVKIQALWRGCLTRKKMRKLQNLYSQIFQELEEPIDIVPYWPKDKITRPVFLRQSEYNQRKSEDDKRKSEEVSRNKLRIGVQRHDLENLIHSRESPTRDIRNLKVDSEDNVIEQCNSQAEFDLKRPDGEKVLASLEINSLINACAGQHINGGELKDRLWVDTDSKGLESTQINSKTVFNSNNREPDSGSENSESSKFSNMANEVHDVNERNSDKQEEQYYVNPQTDKVPEKDSRNGPDLNEGNKEASRTHGGISVASRDYGTGGLTQTVLVSENNGLDAVQEPVKLTREPSEGSENTGLDATFSQALQQTSYWESDKSGDSEEFDLTGMSAEELKKQRSLIGMELLWVQQAIESRKQYLRLKADI